MLTAKVERAPSKPENAAMRHGNLYEAEAREAYERDTNQTCVEFGLKPHDRCNLHTLTAVRFPLAVRGVAKSQPRSVLMAP